MTAKIKLNAASGGGSFSLQAPSSSSNNRVFTIPDEADATLLTSNTSTGKILQVISDTKTDTSSFNVAAGTFYNTSNLGLSVSITPTSASNKILITGQACICREGGQSIMHIAIYKDGSGLSGAMGDADGNRKTVTSGSEVLGTTQLSTHPFSFLDTAGNTNSRVYSIGINHDSGSEIVCYMNRGHEDQNNQYRYRGLSVITVMEVAA